ncbi:hypothetical protein SLNSH_11530 [Alsobacter soli]|uniref:Uncharacterized protein n=1 Tax=Alsobacter soli TaxID=2109933 RepID=A0A2T1HSV7_9HYPH|nr:hypothetical protein [Alsobacter soli]PSC04727.1 hypothetical protein SLNSH_11530 [Alsobacter soli]
MSQLERLEHIMSLCASARRLARVETEPLVARLLDMILLEVGESLSRTPGHRVRVFRPRVVAPPDAEQEA